jgi:uncharacterized membrane protein YfcA
MHFEPWQWAMMAVGAMLAGFSKTGIPGLGILFVGIFVNVLPVRQATGVVLPMLIMGDLFAVALYRRHAQWGQVWRLMPATVVGVILGWFVLTRLNDTQMARLVGLILVLMLVVHLWRKARAGTEAEVVGHAPRWFSVLTGLLAGFATQVANAAGPVMSLYLLAMRLPKLEFLGTGAVFFMLINWFKVPFMVQLDMINRDTLWLNLWLAPAVIAGALLGRAILPRINQKAFESLALALTALAIIKLLFF